MQEKIAWIIDADRLGSGTGIDPSLNNAPHSHGPEHGSARPVVRMRWMPEISLPGNRMVWLSAPRLGSECFIG
jgi:hypothetical protein